MVKYLIANPVDKCALTVNDSIIETLISKYNVPTIDIESSIRAVKFEKINHYYKNRYFLFLDLNNNLCIAVNDVFILKQEFFNEFKNYPVFLVKTTDFSKILEQQFAEENIFNAANYLTNHTNYFSAKSLNYSKSILGFFIMFFSSIIFFIDAFNLFNNIFYFLQNMLKAILFNKGMIKNVAEEVNLDIDELPIYSILVPLYKEEYKVKSILDAIKLLNYPKDKLDVKFIIEADDKLTMRALCILDIPDYVHIIKVPYSFPRTKPKALNYAMSFVLGKYLTVYDAEDEPDPDQLLKSISAFRALPEYYACLQAKLNFYNASENLLTRLFSIEYSVWFEYLLKGLSILDLPVTLGGTSNHFKVDILRNVGLWDAYNVTEDADLGLRLYLSGYKVHMIDSITMEEAPAQLGSWIYQRSRWIKGFIQTIFVFIKTKKDYSKFGLMKIFAVYIFVGLSTYSFFFLPWLLLILFFKLNSAIYYLWFINSFFSYIYMYTIAYIVLSAQKSLVIFKSKIDFIAFTIWPLYFILHTIASYRAVYEIIISPFKWNKTTHGAKDYEDA
ncbi:MAG: glycosyltransferase [Rickettsiales bacterium]|nr:MAG: glycosyltransferase [Rickettsiales bacterium]